MQPPQNNPFVEDSGQNQGPPNMLDTLVPGAKSHCNVKLAKKMGQNGRSFVAAGIADPRMASAGSKEVRLLASADMGIVGHGKASGDADNAKSAVIPRAGMPTLADPGTVGYSTERDGVTNVVTPAHRGGYTTASADLVGNGKAAENHKIMGNGKATTLTDNGLSVTIPRMVLPIICINIVANVNTKSVTHLATGASRILRKVSYGLTQNCTTRTIGGLVQNCTTRAIGEVVQSGKSAEIAKTTTALPHHPYSAKAEGIGILPIVSKLRLYAIIGPSCTRALSAIYAWLYQAQRGIA